MYKLAESTRKDFDELLTDIWGKTNSSDILNSKTVPLKNKENVIDKIANDFANWWKVEKIWDILRWTLEYEKISDLKNWLKMFEKDKRISEVFINNRLDNILTNDILLNIKFKNWFVAEVQLHIKETLHAKQSWFKLDKSIIDMTDMWTKWDLEILEKLKKWEYWGRKLNEKINLPNWNNQEVIWHHLYEIRRSIPDSLKTELKGFLSKIDRIEKELFTHARNLYEKRTWEKFNP